jgi:hypothetical protein
LQSKHTSALKNVKNHLVTIEKSERSMKNMHIHIKLKQIFRNIWKKEYILWGIVLFWTILVWEGHRIIPGAEWLSEIIPAWIVIINLTILFILTTLLVYKRGFSQMGFVETLIGFSISLILFRIGYKRFPSISIIGACAVILVNLALKIRGSKDRSRRE